MKLEFFKIKKTNILNNKAEYYILAHLTSRHGISDDWKFLTFSVLLKAYDFTLYIQV